MNPPRIGLIACSVMEREIALCSEGSTHIQETCFFEMGLHDRPNVLRETLQTAISAMEQRDGIEALVLAYGLCGLGTCGLRPARLKLVIPRAHDCITLFIGSREQYAAHQHTCPSCYYFTPGWNRERRVPGPDRIESVKAELLKRFDPEDVDYLLEAEQEQWSRHDTATYVDLGTADAESEAAYARRCADWLGWKFERIKGDATLLRDLLRGEWDAERFQIIEPGARLGHSTDEAILRSEPVTQ